ncbi:MAG: hypothetical protein ACKO2N_24025 [Tabrizicola sp.]
MRALVLGLMLVPGAAWAEDWVVLKGDGIRVALEARVLVYADGTLQDFLSDGRTLYGDQWGKWGVQGDRYCSLWPPVDRWDCYDLATRGLEVRFTSGSGTETIGTYADLN